MSFTQRLQTSRYFDPRPPSSRFNKAPKHHLSITLDVLAAEWAFSGRAGGLCHCEATEGRPGSAAAATPAGRTQLPACSPSRSAALSSCTDTHKKQQLLFTLCAQLPPKFIFLQVEQALHMGLTHFKMINRVHWTSLDYTRLTMNVLCPISCIYLLRKTLTC